MYFLEKVITPVLSATILAIIFSTDLEQFKMIFFISLLLFSIAGSLCSYVLEIYLVGKIDWKNSFCKYMFSFVSYSLCGLIFALFFAFFQNSLLEIRLIPMIILGVLSGILYFHINVFVKYFLAKYVLLHPFFKKLIIGMILIPLTLIIFLDVYHFPKKIHVEHPAFIFDQDIAGDGTETILRVEGTLYRPTFKDHYFKGSIVIDHYEITKQSNPSDIIFLDNDYNRAFTTYFINENGRLIRFSASISVLDSFDVIYMNVWSEHKNQVGTYKNISAPATSYEEAIQIEKSFTNNANRK